MTLKQSNYDRHYCENHMRVVRSEETRDNHTTIEFQIMLEGKDIDRFINEIEARSLLDALRQALEVADREPEDKYLSAETLRKIRGDAGDGGGPEADEQAQSYAVLKRAGVCEPAEPPHLCETCRWGAAPCEECNHYNMWTPRE